MMSSQEEIDTEPDLQQDQANQQSSSVPDIEHDLQQDQPSQQSSSVHTVRPNQTQVEVQNVSIGDRSAVFLGPATGITVNQNVIQNVTGTPDQEQVQAAARKAKEALKKVYTTTGSFVQMLPWLGADKMHIMDIYTKLRLVEQVDTRGKIPKEENNMQSYEDMFHFDTREGNPIKRVVISGLAGIGKTTLIDKIAYDWALGNSETLKKYELVFVLKMRSLKQSSDLMDAIFGHLLDKNSVGQSALNEFIDNNQDKVLILSDGFDEFKIATSDTSSFGSFLQVLNRKQGTECWVVITSRPPLDKLVNESLVEMPYTHVRVEGFSDTDIEEYVNKFFPEDHDKASKLIEQINLSDTLSDLAKSPMLLLLMCLLWDAEKTLPDTMTRLYKKALNYIFQRKTRHIEEDAISNILISIGKVALGSLLSKDESFAFREEDFEKSALSAAINAGVLTSERIIDGLNTYQRMSFMHHTLLEYCAAMYWQSLINTKEFNGILDQFDIWLTKRNTLTQQSRLSRYDYLLRFCCGDNEACTNRILQKGHQHENRQLAIICYFESQSNKLPPQNVISLVINGYISMMKWDNDSTNAFFYFLKRVTALSRGTDYLTKVKKLNLSYFNFHRFGKDLAESIKLMTNLQSLRLSLSSLTPANTEQILSSLSSLSTLAKLDLPRSKALGGSVSLLAPQLMKLKFLKELGLAQCSLVSQDVSPIAKSVGDTLVKLDVSGNEALGGCASIWGPQLGKMKCLQNIDFEDCSLQGTDIEPIAVALSGVSTLIDLYLSRNEALGGCASIWGPQLGKMECLQNIDFEDCSLQGADIEPIAVALSGVSALITLDLCRNPGLGGCAEMWALHLKRMRHLKDVSLEECSLRDKDVEPIAVALSDIQTLVFLSLKDNQALGGRASLWALHLKKMNQLKGLRLDSCNLTDGDMEPIAESVSDMPSLTNLYLIFNEPLIGCASSWAPHLKRMTNHLRSLRLNGLTDEDEEYINASIGFNSPIIFM